MTIDDKDTTNVAVHPAELGFEDAFRQLAEIAERLEAGGLTLAEATARYELGMRLVQRCNQLLDSAELEITNLRDSYQRSTPGTSVSPVDEPPFFDDATYEDVGDDEESLPF
jgi:exodeoxyribonuclease VII small subunit